MVKIILRDSFDKYYMSLVEIKGCNALIDNKHFCYQRVKRFIGKLENDDGATMSFIAEKQQKKLSRLFFRYINFNRIIRIMEHQKILNLLNKANDSKLVTRKWNISQ